MFPLLPSARFRVWVTVWVNPLPHILTHTKKSTFATKKHLKSEDFRYLLELLGGFEPPTSSLPRMRSTY